MGRWLSNVYRLGIKAIYSLGSDKVLFAFIIYSFSLNIYSEATGIRTDVNNAAIAIVDSDRSALSARIRDGLLKPYFRRPDLIDRSAIDREMDRGTYAFVLDIPSDFEADVLRAKASFCREYDCSSPLFSDNGEIHLLQTRHPLLVRSLSGRGALTVMPVIVQCQYGAAHSTGAPLPT